MMSGVRSLAMLLLCLLLGVHAQVPTVAPTSAPTGGPDEPDASAPTAAPADGGEGAGDDDETGGSTSSEASTGDDTTNVSTSAAPSNDTQTVAKPVTSFKTKIQVANAAAFDETAYLQSIAETTGMPAENVVVKSIDYVIAVTYQFEDNVEEADVKKGAASMANVSEDSVSVTLETVRRLRSEEGRRLAVVATVEITTTSATAADSISSTAANPAKITEGIKAATNKDIAAPSVSVAPVLQVVVKTEVESETAVEVSAPSPEALAGKMKEKTGKDFEVVVTDVEITRPPTTSTRREEGESSLARKQHAVAVVGWGAAFVCAVMASFQN